MKQKSFRTPKFVDHIIESKEGLVVGTIKVKPSGVGWARADDKKWRSVPFDKFVAFMESQGKLTEA